MATTVGSHAVATFTSPVNQTSPIDANQVRGNDNSLRTAYVNHDADAGIHLQSSTFSARPAAGVAGRKWITTDAGSYKLWFDDGTRWHEIGNDAIDLEVIAAETIVKGDVLSVTSFNNGLNLAVVSKFTGAAPAFAIAGENIANGQRGYVVNTGILLDVNTQSFGASGTVLYPAATGTFTSTKPTSGEYQVSAYVLRQNSNNGVLFVEFSASRIVERSDNTASTIVLRDASGNFAAGTITAGAVTSTGLVTVASLKGTGATTVTNILDEDNMASDSATALATQQSIKAYVDAQVGTVDTLAEVLANGNTTGATNIIVSSGQKVTTNTIDETTAAAGVTIDSVLLKDDVVNATDVEVDTISANNGTLAVTLGSTGVATLTQQPIVSSLTASRAVFTDGSKGLVSNAITGTGNVVMSASPTLTGTVTAATLNATTLGGTLSTAAQTTITSVGTLGGLTVTNPITGSVTGSSGSTTGNAATATALQTARAINGVNFDGTAGITVTAAAGTLSGATLASGVTASSLTSVGTLTALTVTGAATAGKLVPTANTVTGNGMYLPTTNALAFSTNGVERARIDASGNVGVGVTPNAAWDANRRVLQVGGSGAVWSGASGAGTFFLSNNVYFDGGSFRYLHTSSASIFAQGTDQVFQFVSAASGTAGDAITFTEKMRIDASGNLGVGVTPGHKLEVKGGSASNVEAGVWESSGGFSALSLNGNMGLGANFYSAPSQPLIINRPTGTAISFRAENVQQMTLDASGNLGVGVTPATKLHVKSSGELLRLETTGATGSNYLDFTDASGDKAYLGFTAGGNENFVIQNRENGILLFATNDAERARITAGGYLKASNDGTYAGVTDAYHEVNSNAAATSIAQFRNSNANPRGVGVVFTAASPDDNTAFFFRADDSTTLRCIIFSDGDIQNHDGVYGTISDVKLKQDITDAGSQWDDLKAIRFRKYRFISDVEAKGEDAPYLLGVVAQELQATSPGLVDSHPDTEQVKVEVEVEKSRPVMHEVEEVVTDADGVESVVMKSVPMLDEDGAPVTETYTETETRTETRQTGTETLSVKSSILLMKAAVALQEAMARIESLEARLDALES